jgi:hypothetical protein
MALSGDYSMQEDGAVLIGATVLDNVTKVNIQAEQERNETTRVAFGTVKKIRSVGKVRVRVTLDMFDETGISGDLKSFRVGDTTGLDATLTIRPLGAGTGLEELILNPGVNDYGMDLLTKEMDAPAGEDLPPVTGNMVWEGFFDEEPAFTAQA